MKAAEITSCFVVLQELQQGMQWGLAPQQEYLVGPSYSLSHSMQFGRSRNTQHVAVRHAQVRQTERAYTRAYVRASLPDDSGWKLQCDTQKVLDNGDTRAGGVKGITMVACRQWR